MPQYHVWRKTRTDENFTKIGDFTSGGDEDQAIRNAEGTTLIDPNTIYFVIPTAGGQAVMRKSRTDTVALEPYSAR